MRILITLAVLVCCATANAAQKNTLYAFESKDCQPCKKMQPTLKRLERRGIKVVHIDIDSKNGKVLAKKFKIDATPTYVSIDSIGREQGREVGVVSEGVLLAMLKVVRFLVIGIIRLLL